jgi:hypothetical protein
MKIEIKGTQPKAWLVAKGKAIEMLLRGYGDYNKGGGFLEDYAKENAPWKDQTTTARNSLTSGLDKTENGYSLWIGQGVEYGRRLETDHDEKYAICKPTIKHFQPILKAKIQEILDEGVKK